MSFSSYAQQTGGFDGEDIALAAQDTVSARLTPGEVMVHPEVQNAPGNEHLMRIIRDAQARAGQDPNAAVAGMSPEMGGQYAQYDPNNPQHFFFKSIWKAIKKIAKNPIARMALTAAAGMTGQWWLAPLVSGTLTKAAGGSWGQAIGSAALSAAGSHLLKGTTQGNMTIGDKLGSTDLGSTIASGIEHLPSALAEPILGQNVGSMIGFGLGEAAGQTLGGMIDPPKAQILPEEGDAVGLQMPHPSQLPTPQRNIGLPANQMANLYDNSNIGPVDAGFYGKPSGAQLPGSDLGSGAWSDNVPGLTYLQSRKDREGKRQDVEVGTFGSMLDRNNRRFGLSGGGAGVAYY